MYVCMYVGMNVCMYVPIMYISTILSNGNSRLLYWYPQISNSNAHICNGNLHTCNGNLRSVMVTLPLYW